jgi:hypothetical protein
MDLDRLRLRNSLLSVVATRQNQNSGFLLPAPGFQGEQDSRYASNNGLKIGFGGSRGLPAIAAPRQ